MSGGVSGVVLEWPVLRHGRNGGTVDFQRPDLPGGVSPFQERAVAKAIGGRVKVAVLAQARLERRVVHGAQP